MATNAGRTVNGVPKHAQVQAANPMLRIDGSGLRSVTLTPAQIDALPHVATRQFLTVEERERTPDYDLGGVLLTEILNLIVPGDDVQFVCFGAGPYTHPVSLNQIERVILCDRINGEPIPADRGGPWRVLIPAHSYNMGVKWVDRIELTVDEPDDSAQRIAEARERARQFKRAHQPDQS